MKKMPLIIINFEGIIGDILKIPVFDPTAKLGLYLKNGVVENMPRLLNKFQTVIVTSQEAKADSLLLYFKSVGIVFDAMYHRQNQDSTNELFSSYAHIYEDFGLPLEDVKWNALLLCPILLENIEIKNRNNDQLVCDILYTWDDEYSNNNEELPKAHERKNKTNQFHIKHLSSPEDKLDAPVTILVPHFLSQLDNKSMWFSNVVTFVESLYIASATNDDDKIGSPVRKKPNFTVTERQYSKEEMGSQSKPNFL